MSLGIHQGVPTGLKRISPKKSFTVSVGTDTISSTTRYGYRIASSLGSMTDSYYCGNQITALFAGFTSGANIYSFQLTVDNPYYELARIVVDGNEYDLVRINSGSFSDFVISGASGDAQTLYNYFMANNSSDVDISVRFLRGKEFNIDVRYLNQSPANWYGYEFTQIPSSSIDDSDFFGLEVQGIVTTNVSTQDNYLVRLPVNSSKMLPELKSIVDGSLYDLELESDSGTQTQYAILNTADAIQTYFQTNNNSSIAVKLIESYSRPSSTHTLTIGNSSGVYGWNGILPYGGISPSTASSETIRYLVALNDGGVTSLTLGFLTDVSGSINSVNLFIDDEMYNLKYDGFSSNVSRYTVKTSIDLYNYLVNNDTQNVTIAIETL